MSKTNIKKKITTSEAGKLGGKTRVENMRARGQLSAANTKAVQVRWARYRAWKAAQERLDAGYDPR